MSSVLHFLVVEVRERQSVHIRVKTSLWKQFLTSVKAQGFSTCFIIETLLQAYLAGAPAPKSYHPGASIIIKQKIDYNVKKSRRTRAGPPDNVYKNGVWSYRQIEKGEVTGKLGHAIECECAVCKPWERRRG